QRREAREGWVTEDTRSRGWAGFYGAAGR
ncbi:MAG: hypothetical protein RIQ79_1297, partial [Verrucomicrobiota bacterium]